MEDFLLPDEPAEPSPANQPEPWLIAIIDDEPSVHDVTIFALQGLDFAGRGFRFLSAYSAAEGRALLADNPDIACVLLDVVMETSSAGLDLVATIRQEMENTTLRIILRTGQPGASPQVEVLKRFDINDYREKTELTQTRLWSTIACALRGYQQIVALERSRDGLEMIIRTSAWLMQRHAVMDFSEGVVNCLTAHLGISAEGLLCVGRKEDHGAILVLGGAGAYAKYMGVMSEELPDPTINRAVHDVLNRKEDIIGPDFLALSVESAAWNGVIYVKGRAQVDKNQTRMLRLFCNNVALGLENVKLFEIMANLAFTDGLTGLSSRVKLVQTIAAEVERGAPPMVLVADIDDFHTYNLDLGHRFSEAVLKAFAERLRLVIGNVAQVGRLYSDVFCIVLTDRDLPAQEVMARLREPLLINGDKVRLGVTFGLTGGVTSDLSADLLQQAEVAMKLAKASRRGSFAHFTKTIESPERGRAVLVNELREAMAAGGEGIYLAYQPQVDTLTGAVRSVEALVRWTHPQRGLVSPGEFIPAAEATGAIVDLGFLILRRVCREMKPLLVGGRIKNVAVNVSPIQLREPSLLQSFDQIIREEGLTRDQIEIEITESAALSGESALEQLAALRRSGHMIAMDDFGTGYSSLSMLRRMPLDVVKIDQSFLSKTVDDDARLRPIVMAIAQVCRHLGIASLIEGVETAQHMDLAREAEIDFVQGYLIARPLSPEALAQWLIQRS